MSQEALVCARERDTEDSRVCVQSCLALCDPMDYNLPRSSVCGIFQAGILKWVAITRL